MRRQLLGTALIWLAATAAWGWDAHGHRTVTYLALDGLPATAPDWLREPTVRERIAHQSNQADRWRGWRAAVLGHENKPDHYLDIELLDQFGLTLETVPPLRYEYLRALAVAKHVHPERVDPYDAGRDPDRSKEWPGFLPHAIVEHYVKLQATFNELRILERLAEPRRAHQVETARANIIYHMGMLSHFVADGAQPLHTTKHFNGWVGDNPEGYTTSRGFHAYVDGDVLEDHGLTYDALRPLVKFDLAVNAADPWDDVLAYLRRSFEQVEPLYRLERDGTLKQEAGKTFITQRLNEAAAMLSALYAAAFTSAAPTDKQIEDFLRFNNLPGVARSEASASRPAEPGPSIP